MRNLIMSLGLALLCSGCALTTATIDVPYQPLAPASHVKGAEAITVTVGANDQRSTYRDRVGTKKNGYGMDMAAIVASNDLPSTVQAAFQQELAARGFLIGANGVSLEVDLLQFYNDFKLSMFSSTAVSTVAFNVKIVAPNGTIAFSKFYQGTGNEPGLVVMSPGSARDALIKGFQIAVASVVNDPDFTKALLSSGAGKR